MSKKEPPSRAPSRPRKRDARIHRTHERLGIALLELIRDKPIDSVTVQQVLDRASVGRSTFYLHFRDKNDLLLSQLEMFLEFMSTTLSAKQDATRRLAPVTEMFDMSPARRSSITLSPTQTGCMIFMIWHKDTFPAASSSA
jgi:AcrR family transcriptional regulator